jgi:hypothetical protein
MSVEIIRQPNNRFRWRLKSGRRTVSIPETILSPLTSELSDEEAASYRDAVQSALGKLFREQQDAGAK